MEYSLLKQIVPNRSYFPIGISTHPTHFPGFDCINPGIGNVASPFSYFVPTHFTTNPNLQVKNRDTQNIETPESQEGKGKELIAKESQVTENAETEVGNSASSSKDEESEKILNELNARKKKLLDSAIYESFLHPKRIKTEILHLKNVQKAKELKVPKIKVTEKTPLSNVKHKFKFE